MRERLESMSIKLGHVVAGALLFGLAACATPEPKYPVYMSDKPVAPATTATEETVASGPPPVVTASTGSVQSSELPPPPPPPPPPEDVSTIKPATAVPAPPAPKPAPVQAKAGGAFVYIMAPKDTLYGISRRFGVSVKDIYALNDFASDATFKIGQKVLLPSHAKDKGVEAHANGDGLTPVATMAAASIRPATPVSPPPASTPAPAPASAKPTVTTPVKPAAAQLAQSAPAPSPVVAKPTAVPVVTPPVPKPAPAVTTPAKPAASTSAPAAAGGFPSNAKLAEMGKGRFLWPVKGKIIVPFGQLAPSIRNDGVNIQASTGTEVHAAADGVVVYQGDQVRELGKTIYVKHDGGWYTGYSHLSQIGVKNNQAVKKGEVIGTVGQTGVIDKPQLHFEIRYTPSTDIAKPIDPTLVLPAQ